MYMLKHIYYMNQNMASAQRNAHETASSAPSDCAHYLCRSYM